MVLLGVVGGPVLFLALSSGFAVDLRGPVPLVLRSGDRRIGRWVPSLDGAWSACVVASGDLPLVSLPAPPVPPP